MNREAVASQYFACPDTFPASFINQTEEDTGAATKLTVKTIILIYNFPVVLNYSNFICNRICKTGKKQTFFNLNPCI